MISYSGVAQENYTSEKSINAFNLLIFKTLDFTFERYIDQESSWGMSTLLSLEGDSRFNGDNPYYYESIGVTPFYRLYFGNRAYEGFFVEGFGNLSFGLQDSWDYYSYPDCYTCDYVYNSSDHIRSFTSFNIGLSLGRKWVTKKDITFSVIGGIGRAIFTDKGPGFFPRLGISIGKRK